MHIIPKELTLEILQRAGERQTSETRLMVAIAGPPASGKSTLAEALAVELNRELGQMLAVVLPMDGFHLDNTLLDNKGSRARKGAPHTFDVDGFAALLQRVITSTQSVIIPVFDRHLDLARAGGREILPEHRVILVEGNYLLLDRPGWSSLSALFDYRVFLHVDEAELSRRLIQRWLDHQHNLQEATARAESNDLPNARLVLSASLPADKIIQYQSDPELHS